VKFHAWQTIFQAYLGRHGRLSHPSQCLTTALRRAILSSTVLAPAQLEAERWLHFDTLGGRWMLDCGFPPLREWGAVDGPIGLASYGGRVHRGTSRLSLWFFFFSFYFYTLPAHNKYFIHCSARLFLFLVSLTKPTKISSPTYPHRPAHFTRELPDPLSSPLSFPPRGYQSLVHSLE